MNTAPSMLLITSTWGQEKTFKMIPVTPQSPFNEAIYDPANKVLALVGKDKKETFHMMPKLNELGDPQTLKIGKRDNGKSFAEQRVSLDTYYEYFIEEPTEITDFVKMFAINADSFDFDVYLKTETKEEQPSSPLILS